MAQNETKSVRRLSNVTIPLLIRTIFLWFFFFGFLLNAYGIQITREKRQKLQDLGMEFFLDFVFTSVYGYFLFFLSFSFLICLRKMCERRSRKNGGVGEEESLLTRKRWQRGWGFVFFITVQNECSLE